ncbi:MAG: transcriptional regulator, partial [Solirubrobacteraceae bacterium]
ALHAASPDFTAIWDQHDIGARPNEPKHKLHPTVGPLTLDCQTLTCEDDGQALLVYTATPGSEDREKLDLLRVIGDQAFAGTPD